MNDLDKAQMMAPEGEFLAYINPKEAGILKALGGSGKMTAMGIPSFTEDEEDTGDVSNPGSGGGSGGGGNNSGGGGDQEDDNARMMRDMGLRGPGFTNLGGGEDPPSFFQTVGNLYNRFSPVANIGRGIGFLGRGIGNLFDKFADLRGFNPDGSRRTQDEYEKDRQDRINQNRISNILGREAPFTQMTLDNLSRLGYDGPMGQDLIGTTNNMRTMNNPTFGPVTEGTIYDAEEPELGILSQAPYSFRDAMREINLQPGFNARQNTGELIAEQLSFPYDFMNTGDPYKDNLYDQDGNYKPSLNNLFAKVDGPAQIQMRRLEKQAGMEQFGGTPLSPGERKALEQLKQMDADQDNVYTTPVSIV